MLVKLWAVTSISCCCFCTPSPGLCASRSVQVKYYFNVALVSSQEHLAYIFMCGSFSEIVYPFHDVMWTAF